MILFKRERTPIELVIYGVFIYNRSRSSRSSSEILEPFIKRNYRSILYWWHRFGNFSEKICPRIKSKIALVDETLFKIKNKEAILWIAFEPYRRIFIDFQITIGKGSLNSIQAYKFLKILRNKHGVRIIYTDEASYYHLAAKLTRIKHYIYDDKWKNLIERFIQNIKDRIECFDDYFPCFNECNYEHIKEWINSFKIDYNLIRIHGFIKKPPLGWNFKKTIMNRFLSKIVEVSNNM